MSTDRDTRIDLHVPDAASVFESGASKFWGIYLARKRERERERERARSLRRAAHYFRLRRRDTRFSELSLSLYLSPSTNYASAALSRRCELRLALTPDISSRFCIYYLDNIPRARYTSHR